MLPISYFIRSAGQKKHEFNCELTGFLQENIKSNKIVENLWRDVIYSDVIGIQTGQEGGTRGDYFSMMMVWTGSPSKVKKIL